MNTTKNERVFHSIQGSSHVPGYMGYIPGVRSQNLFGQTYGKITNMSSGKAHHVGSDLPPDLRFVSTIQNEFRQQMNVSPEITRAFQQQQRFYDNSVNFFGQNNGNNFQNICSGNPNSQSSQSNTYKDSSSFEKPETDLTYEQARQIAYKKEEK